MKNLSAPLNDDELDRLDRFLLDRFGEDVDVGDRDEGVLNLSELDGLLTAIVSGPVLIQPSRWLPAIWGDFDPVWDGAEDFEGMLSLLVRHMNGISSMLMGSPEDFEPLFLENTFEGRSVTIVDEWCEGYMRGVALAADSWQTDDLAMTVLLTPIRAFTSETDWLAHDQVTEAGIENIRNAIVPNVREIHAYWLARRADLAPRPAPMQRAEPRIGRNEPCPCGSGRKYKKCCLH